MAVGGVTTTAGTVIINAAKELSWLMRVNLLTWATEIGEDAGAVSTIVAVAMRVSRPQRRCSRGKQLEKPACTELEPRNRSSAVRIAARDITERHKGIRRGAKEGSISKGECE